MTVERKEATAEGLAMAIADSLKPGRHGTPVIVERFGKMDGSRAGFVVQSSETGESYRVTVQTWRRGAQPEASTAPKNEGNIGSR